MVETIQSIVIGAIQGISEFFPISSSGHLVLVPYVFNWNYKGLAFDVALHFGTAIAITTFFWRDWTGIIKNTFSKVNNSNSSIEGLPKNFLWQILIASIPAAIVGLFLDDIVEKSLHSPVLIAFNLIFFGLILWLTDKYSMKNKKLSTIGYIHSLIVGLAQAIALIPGVSRSGITISTARILGLSRKDAAKFSFLVATPAIIGASLLKIKDLTPADLGVPFISGIVASTIFGFLAIKYLLKYLEKGDFIVFVWYRIILAIVILTLVFIR